ncbi:MAG: purine-nucleoside phosphorylase [Proteobacteria bacterium]|nr:purine-nucleoside phosphorylase [Pseudomonadota bacterium]
MAQSYKEQLQHSAKLLQDKIKGTLDLFVIAGSGFRDAIPDLGEKVEFDMSSIQGVPIPSVAGHGAKFIFGTFTGKKVLFATGRVHGYENRHLNDVVFNVRMAHFAGCKNLLLTNAAGSVDRKHPPGSLTILKDHLNLTGFSCETGNPVELPHMFIDMTNCYNEKWRSAIRESCRLSEGIYAGLPGPCYETRAEANMYASWGANLVGMSTVQECIAARALNMNVAGISLVTNFAGGLGGITTHDDVLKMAETKREAMKSAIEQAIISI